MVEDDIGNHLNVWEDYFSCRGTISGETGAESENAGIANDHREMYVTVRWCRKVAGISSIGFRLVFHGEVFNIAGIDDLSYRRSALSFGAERSEGMSKRVKIDRLAEEVSSCLKEYGEATSEGVKRAVWEKR